jgi:hypothetical protein
MDVAVHVELKLLRRVTIVSQVGIFSRPTCVNRRCLLKGLTGLY